MMLALLMALCQTSPTENLQLTLPGLVTRIDIRSQDLNGDQLADFWLRGDDGELWVWLRGSDSKQFQKLEIEPLHFDAVPHWLDGRWGAKALTDHGILLVYTPDRGWEVASDLGFTTRLRETVRDFAFQGETERAVLKTMDAFYLFRGSCLEARIEVAPALSVNRRSMQLSFPEPQWHDLDQDGDQDLLALPIDMHKQGELLVWRAFNRGNHWESGWASLQMPAKFRLVNAAFGDLNGDKRTDLVVLCRPGADFSIFEEMSFLIYKGTDAGTFETVPSQTLESKQNLWQDGPIEVDGEGIKLFYFKGLFRSFFRMDHFAWNPAGFIEPKSKKISWATDGDGDSLRLEHDLNGDGLRDMIMPMDEGVKVHYRNAQGDLFEKDNSGWLMSSAKRIRRIRNDRLLGRRGVGILTKDLPAMELWQVTRQENGFLLLTRYSQ